MRNSACQKFIPKTIRLATFSTQNGLAGNVAFRLPIPDSRLRTKISVLFVPPSVSQGQPDLSTMAPKIWLAESENDYSGVSGGTILTTNLVGTSLVPQAIAATPLLGYSREFVSAADNIEGVLSWGSWSGVGTNNGNWVLQVRFQPQSVRFTEEEWNEIRNQCSPELITGPVIQ